MRIAPGTALVELVARLEDAATGAAQVVSVHGRVGSGKSWVLDELAARAAGRARVLRCSGHPAERDLPYAGLSAALAPLGAEIARLGPQRSAPLEMALARLPAAPAQTAAGAAAGEAAPASPPDRLAVASAVLALVASVAEREPVVLLVDDVQWLDVASVLALTFTARRLEADAVLVVLAGRDEPHDLDDVPGGTAGTLLDDRSFAGTRIDLAPLDDVDARRVLATTCPALHPAVADRVLEHAAGLPLALVQVPQGLSAAERAGRAELPDILAVGPTLSGYYGRRLHRLPEATTLALLVVALDELSPAETLDALDRLGLDASALAPAERSGLVEAGSAGIRVQHPTVRQAVTAAATYAHRRRAHAALADVLGAEPARAARHLEALATGPDARTADVLEKAALAAARRGAHDQAGRAWQSAARLSPDAGTAARRREAAALAWFDAGRGAPLLALLDRLVADATDPGAAARWLTLRLLAGADAGSPVAQAAAVEDLVARLLPGRSGEAAALLVAYAITLALGGYLRPAGDMADRARSVRGEPGLALVHRLAVDSVDVFRGRPGSGHTLRSSWAELLDDDALLDPALPVSPFVVHLAWMGDPDRAATVMARQRRALEGRGRPSALAIAVAQEAVVLEIQGRWAEAAAGFERAAQLGEAGTLDAALPYFRLRHARLLAARGDTARVEEILAEPAVAALQGLPMHRHAAACARGLLLLGTGDAQGAAAQLAAAAVTEDEMGLGEPAFLPRFGDAFEAAWRLGTHEELRAALDAFEAHARDLGRTTAIAIALRCRGLLSGDDADFTAACAAHESSPQPFEQARTLLAWGRVRRRARRRAAAREPLHRALAVFAVLGADCWTGAAEAELAACGERRATAPAAALAGLTPREADIALEVARGASNAEVAARLVLSRRTVEYHLGNAFRKLAVSGRGDLASALGVTHPRTAH
ncbi:AAA family ATPase [Antribacter gilvus]|uniref:AAA family ATPase n=1 Tax=Antribacter gilvus TaxID=2304675 RepID=UPI000F76D522|nr:LuxR family transcriptional regulator [Antribacter gilvus]